MDHDILIQAGIRQEKVILLALPGDAANVFIVLSAPSLNAALQIISRVFNQSAAAKLYKAGANNVIMPPMIGGTRMATIISKSDAIEFVAFFRMKKEKRGPLRR